jgi:hypothetical protein
MSEPLPIIEGVADPSREVEDRVEKQELLEQVAQMDMVRKVPTDEMREYSDIKKQESQETIIERASEINKRLITDKQRAALERARMAKAEKKRRMNAEGLDAAQGAPPANALVDERKWMEERFQAIEDRLHDLVKIRGHEAPLQPQHIVEHHPVTLQPPPQSAADPQTIPVLPKREVPDTLEEVTLVTPQAVDYRKDDLYARQDQAFKRKFKDVFSNLEFYTEDVNKRGKIDASMGQRPGRYVVKNADQNVIF